jgi:error-prone DNA polymerase
MSRPLFGRVSESLREDSGALPLQQMNIEERTVADYAGTGLTVGKHPMHYRRPELHRAGILTATELSLRDHQGVGTSHKIQQDAVIA